MGRKDDERKGRIISGRKDDEKGRKGKEEGRLWLYVVDRRDRRGEMRFTPPPEACLLLVIASPSSIAQLFHDEISFSLPGVRPG